LPDRLQTVLIAIYLMYTTGQGRPKAEPDLCSESIRLGRMLRLLMPDEPEVAGLLALMLLTESRCGTRTDEFGALVLLRDQNRAGWNRALIGEGHALVRWCLRRNQPGPYQLQAAIAPVHADAASFAETDWAQIRTLYDQLMVVALPRSSRSTEP
jgi:RNA polymerase sigma-70 factor (ECF subfamily)